MIERRTIATVFGASMSALAMALATPAAAQGPGSGPPADEAEETAAARGNDIIVTARRIDERLQDVPITVSALTSEDLSRQAIDDLIDVADKTVGFSFEALSGAIVQPAIRGQTNLRVDSPVQNVAFYIDGIYLQRGYLVDQSLLELQRVEVIKGPQSALYGRNAFAGAVNMVTRAPSLTDFSAKLSGTIGTDDRYDGRASVSIPIIDDRLALFLSAAHSQFDGTWRNQHPLRNGEGAITKGNVGGYNKEAYQARIIAKPTDSLTLDASYIRTERLIEASPGYIQGNAGITSGFNSLNCSPVSGQNRLFCGALSATPRLAPGEPRLPGIVIDPRAFGLRGPTDVAQLKLAFNPGGIFAASYQYGYTKAKITGRGNVSRDPLQPFVFFNTNFGVLFDSSGTDSSFKGQSHEFRLTYEGSDRIDAFVGVNYSHTVDINANASEIAPIGNLTPPNPNLAFFPIGPGLAFPSNFFQRNTYIKRSEDIFSAFAFINVAVTDQLDVTLEGRFTLEDQEAVDLLTRDPANAMIQNRNPPRFARETSYFTPRATVAYKLTPDNNVYASIARGVKSGGLNGNTPFVGQRSYGNETNWTYEIGSKNNFMDGALILNLAAFFTDWKNLQGGQVRLLASGAPPASFVQIVPSTVGNIGNVKVYGVEAEGSFRIAPPLRLNFGASYNRSRYTDGSFSQRVGASGNCDGVVCTTVVAPGQPTRALPLGGNQVERIPDFEALAGLTFDTEFNNGWSFFARGDVTYQTKSFTDETNLAFSPDRTLVNASTGVTIDIFSVQLWAKNLFDKKYVSNAFVLIGTGGGLSASVNPTLGDRRTIGLTGSVAF